MGHITEQLQAIRATLPEGVTLVAVSKFHPVESIREAYDAGQRVFGESRAAELTAKAQALPDDISWHFIGHLQTNKVRQVVPYAALIHSIDSERLLRAVDAEAARVGRTVNVLLQLHVALEETKFGFSPDELLQFVSSGVLETLPHVKVRGVMGMASNVDDEERIASDFRSIKAAFDRLRLSHPSLGDDFNIISMGMSHDYLSAIMCGSNMVRIGTTIFGEREY